MQKQVFRAGDMHHLALGKAGQYKMPNQWDADWECGDVRSCWALEYARGNIPFMLPFGLADTFTRQPHS